MRNWIIGIIIIIIIAFGVWWFWGGGSSAQPTSGEQSQEQSVATPRTPITTAVYACDGGKSITATYYNGPEAPTPQPGQPPQPTGSADVSLDGGATTTLAQTISADGARYASSDGSFVFWSKGDQALIMRDNSMDQDYQNCTQTNSTTDQSS